MQQSERNNDIAGSVLLDFGRMSGNRSTWEGHWDEIAQRVWPSMSGMFYQNGQARSPGEKRTEHQYDSTAAVALGRFAAVVDSLLTPMNQKWHLLRATDAYLMRQRGVRLYFEELTNTLFRYRRAPAANFIGQNHMGYRMLGAFGTGVMYVDQFRGGRGLRYKSIHLGEIYFAENHQGVIDKAWRRFSMTARQMRQRWTQPGMWGGEQVYGLPEKIANDKDENTLYWIVQCVKPREDLDPGRADYKGMEFASYYVAEEGKHLLSEGGYSSFPFPTSRYVQGPGEVYGRSPAMEVLPAIKTLNEEKKTVLKQGHRTVDPVLLAHDDGVLDGFSLRPGAINSGGVNADGRPLVQALPVGNIAIGKDLMDDERLIINDAFLVSLFQILVETPQMTATEVLERTKEKGMLLTPTVGRQQSEYLGPLIERELDLLDMQGLLPEMPGVLREAQGEYEVEYDSPLSRAAEAGDAAGFMRTVETALNVANVTQDPSHLDHFDFDEALPAIAAINGAPTRWMRDAAGIAAIREGRDQAAQQQQAIAAAPGQAALIKAASVADQPKKAPK